MIARLTGFVAAIEEGRCVLDVAGVGYLVSVSARTLAALPVPPALARLFVETQFREDAIVLYGFADAAERDLFRLLITVQGVGAKLALSLLSTLSPDQLSAAIAAGERVAVARAPGVGSKLAGRIIAELREKLAGLGLGAAVPAAPAEAAGPVADAISALLHLGYRRAEAEPAVARALGLLGEAAGPERLIPAALRELAR